MRERLRARDALGDDVAIGVERGERSFARGDRVMFLRNERSLGVKNGTLGEVRSATSTRLAVLLDDGRSVAFDVKDYAAIDHGYAATVHKAQGMTVDRVHVLATPGLDRHAAYVALSRHRDNVELHYGRDDFADRRKLAQVLSRERGRDMAGDFLRAPEAELRPASPPVTLDAAVARHGRIVQSMRFANSIGEPYTPDQRAELTASRAILDAIQPYGARDLESAFASDHSMIGEAAKGRVVNAVRVMQLEREMRLNPDVRADVFVQRWQSLDRQRRILLRDREDSRAGTVADRMIGMAKSLERDPQVESILRNRMAQLGLPPTLDRGVGQSLANMIGKGRSRGLDIGM